MRPASLQSTNVCNGASFHCRIGVLSTWVTSEYPFSFAHCRKFLTTKFRPCVRKITHNAHCNVAVRKGPTQRTKVVQELWKRMDPPHSLDKRFIPQQSSVLIPFHYSVWVHIERNASKLRLRNTEILSVSISAAWAEHTWQGYFRRMFKGIRSCLEFVML